MELVTVKNKHSCTSQLIVMHWLVMLQCTEWDQFQSDLLMTVRVANDFKTEAQQELEKLVLENKSLRDKLRGLEAQIDKLKGRPLLSLQPHALTISI
jgi:cell division protein FtsB